MSFSLIVLRCFITYTCRFSALRCVSASERARVTVKAHKMKHTMRRCACFTEFCVCLFSAQCIYVSCAHVGE